MMKVNNNEIEFSLSWKNCSAYLQSNSTQPIVSANLRKVIMDVNNHSYYSSAGKKVVNSEDKLLVVVDTLYKNNKNENLYLLFKREFIKSNLYVLLAIGSIDIINSTLQNTTKFAKFFKDVKDSLMCNILVETKENTIEYSYSTYIRALYAFYTQYYKKKYGVMFNDTKTKCILNTKLIDKSGNYIYIIGDNIHRNGIDKLENINILRSYDNIVKTGFMEERKPLLPSLADISDILYSQATVKIAYSSYDLYTHILNDRRDRLAVDLPDHAIINTIIRSVDIAMSITKNKYDYILPLFNIRENSISYSIPILDDTNKHIYSLVIKKGENGVYTPRTVLAPEVAFNNANVITAFNSSWCKNPMDC